MKQAVLLWSLVAWSTLFTAFPARAELLVIEFGDSHSSFDGIEGAVLTAVEAASEFKQRHPKGEVVLIAAGDIGGMSEWTEGFGDEMWEMIAVLSARMSVVAVPGNHETFDRNAAPLYRGDVDGNQLFYDQTKYYQGLVEKHSGTSTKLLNASIASTKQGRELFQPYQDLTLPNGKTVRFVGLLLEEFFKKCLYMADSPIQLFYRDAERNIEEELRRQVNEAFEDGIDYVVPVAHDYYQNVKNAVESLREWRKDREFFAIPELPFAVAAHDHESIIDRDAKILDSGPNLSMVIAEFDDKLDMVDARPVTREAVRANAERISPKILSDTERGFLETIRPKVQAMREKLSRVRGVSAHPLYNKARNKKGPELSGQLAAGSLQIEFYSLARMRQAQLLLTKKPDPVQDRPADSQFVVPLYRSVVPSEWLDDPMRSDNMVPVIAFHNSSSYRNDIEIPEGADITDGDLWRMYPFHGFAEGVFVTAEEALRLYISLHDDRELHDETFTPQISPNMILDDWHHPTSISVYDGGKLQTLAPQTWVLLALDPFSAFNGYRVRAWKEILMSPGRRWLPRPEKLHRAVLSTHYPELAGAKDCVQALLTSNKKSQEKVARTLKHKLRNQASLENPRAAK